MQTIKPFAEVIESSLNTWHAQCWQWDNIPAYGSLVTIETDERVIFGLIHEIHTGSADSARTVFTYKKTEEELKRDHPHIFEFLQTSFSCLTLGYQEQGAISYQLAPQPPKIHAFVQTATRTQLEDFFKNEQYLHTLFACTSHVFSLDELLLALLKHLADHHLLTETKLAGFLETFSLLTANDYRRLKLFLQRAQKIIQSKEY